MVWRQSISRDHEADNGDGEQSPSQAASARLAGGKFTDSAGGFGENGIIAGK